MHPAAAAGFIAGDGYLWAGATRFALVVQVAERDIDLLRDLSATLGGVGTIRTQPSRRPGCYPVAVLRVDRLEELARHVAPLLEEWLPPCHRRTQFDEWVVALRSHLRTRASAVRTCTVQGCGDVRRAKGLCRRHYYCEHGR